MPSNKAEKPSSETEATPLIHSDWLPASEFIAKRKPIELAREGNTIIVPASVWLPKMRKPGEVATYEANKPLPSMPRVEDLTLAHGGMFFEHVILYRDTGEDGNGEILKFFDPNKKENDE